MTTPRTARADSAHQTTQADVLSEAVIAELGELKGIRSERVTAGFRAVPRGSTRPATVTSTVDGRDHLVSAAAGSVGLAAGHGRSVALCGRLVLAASLTVPPRPTCLECETALHRVTAGGHTSSRRYGRIARLLRRGSSRTGWRVRSAGRHRAVRP
ncbi:MAG: hypothetical protein ABR608_03585 [Pseudonocardiaceae bacterium]